MKGCGRRVGVHFALEHYRLVFQGAQHFILQVGAHWGIWRRPRGEMKSGQYILQVNWHIHILVRSSFYSTSISVYKVLPEAIRTLLQRNVASVHLSNCRFRGSGHSSESIWNATENKVSFETRPETHKQFMRTSCGFFTTFHATHSSFLIHLQRTCRATALLVPLPSVFAAWQV